MWKIMVNIQEKQKKETLTGNGQKKCQDRAPQMAPFPPHAPKRLFTNILVLSTITASVLGELSMFQASIILTLTLQGKY